MKQASVCLVLSLLALLAAERSSSSLGMPLERVDEYWTPTSAETVSITAMRLEIVPSRDPVADVLMWSVDETLALFNHGAEEVVLSLGIPNIWSAGEPVVGEPAGDFWAEAFVNGSLAETEIVRVVPNPSHPEVDYGVARKFTVRIPAASSAYVRLMFALPAGSTAAGESRLLYPFQLRELWDGDIEFGTIVVRWRDRVFSFRTNLPGYALYADRAEWFLRQFRPSDELDIRFLPRLAVFRLVGESLGCPMPWEIVDRVADGRPDSLRDFLAGYRTDQLELCVELPATLRGSVHAARASGLSELRLEQFADSESGISGPLFVADPDYNPDQMTESEALYTRFIRQELDTRRVEGTH